MPKPGFAVPNRAADSLEPHFIPQLFHPTPRHSYNATYYSLMQPNVDICVYTEKQGRENGKGTGPHAVWRKREKPGDNIWVLNWYRLAKYPDQEERAAVLSCLYTMSAPTAPSCTVTIWSILIQTSSPPGQTSFSTQCAHVCVSLQRLHLLRNFYVSACNVTLNSRTEDYWFHTWKGGGVSAGFCHDLPEMVRKKKKKRPRDALE